jgi:uncharacterized membrane protein YesL
MGSGSFGGRLYETLSKLCDLIALNLLFLLTSLPIVTIGASFTALYSVTLKMTDDRESYVARSYFRAFKRCFGRATLLWGVFAVAGCAIWLNLRLTSMAGGEAAALRPLMLPAVIVWIVVLAFTFPVLARYDCKAWDTLKYALLIPAANVKYILPVMLCPVIPFLFLLAAPELLSPFVFLAVLLGFSGPAYFASGLLGRIFRTYEPRVSGIDKGER